MRPGLREDVWRLLAEGFTAPDAARILNSYKAQVHYYSKQGRKLGVLRVKTPGKPMFFTRGVNYDRFLGGVKVDEVKFSRTHLGPGSHYQISHVHPGEIDSLFPTVTYQIGGYERLIHKDFPIPFEVVGYDHATATLELRFYNPRKGNLRYDLLVYPPDVLQTRNDLFANHDPFLPTIDHITNLLQHDYGWKDCTKLFFHGSIHYAIDADLVKPYVPEVFEKVFFLSRSEGGERRGGVWLDRSNGVEEVESDSSSRALALLNLIRMRGGAV